MSGPGSEQLRLAIRELLAEELAKLRGGQGAVATADVRVEPVSLRDDHELAAFVAHLGRLYADNATRAGIEAGRHVFRLADAGTPPPVAQGGGPTATFARTLVSEREVNALADGTHRVVVTKKTRFTPLAKDALRRRGITIERSPS